MQKLIKILNSPIGLVVAGAIISGICVQYIASEWQQENWLFQQSYTAERTKFEKELEQKYKILEDTNEAVVDILTHSQMVVVDHMKQMSPQQRNEQIRKYNEAVTKWEKKFSILRIRLQTFFVDKRIFEIWNDIKEKRDRLDVSIYLLTSNNHGKSEESLALIEQITLTSIELSQYMILDINKVKQRGFAQNGDN